MYLALGTAALGRPLYINIRHVQHDFSMESFTQNAQSVLDEAYRLGIRHFDTAPGYGLAEKLLIDWLQTKNDDSITVSTKWGYTYVADFNPNAKTHEVKEHSLSKLNEQWQDSKALLPYLSVYQIHSATLESNVLQNRTILERLAFLKRRYAIGIGITTTGVNQTEVIKKALDVEVDGNQLFDSFQCTYNMLDQSISKVLKDLKNQQKVLLVKEALANGRLLPNSKLKQYQSQYKELNFLATKYNVGVDAIALQYCHAKLNVDWVLSGATNSAHLRQNLKTLEVELNEEELANLDTFKIDPKDYWNERKQLQWN
ncbi:MAG: aldo/keto reductase [Flavobacteriaceae bacterium]|nr:aldo/keto reductase [Flavobacteriaceae bacterium]